MFLDLLGWLFSTDPFMPHGYCLLWQPDLVASHVVSDAIIALAYFTIPVFLVTLVRQRQDIIFSWAFYAFGAFILLCGTTHVMSIVALWLPLYGLEAVIKIATAIASVVTAIAVWPLLPKLLALPSHAELEEANNRLEQRVAERTTALEQANRQLRVLLQEVHHRVKNNLQVIASMLRLSQRRFDDPKVSDAIEESVRRISAISLVHEALYGTERLAEMSFGAYLRKLVEHMRRADPRSAAVTVTVEADETALGLDQSIPLALITNEAVSNALKHAFPDGRPGRIDIVLRSGNGSGRLEIRDDGGGAVGEPAPSGPGLGMKIIQALARQLDGEADFSTGPAGSSLVLEFPVPTGPKPAPDDRAVPNFGGLTGAPAPA